MGLDSHVSLAITVGELWWVSEQNVHVRSLPVIDIARHLARCIPFSAIIILFRTFNRIILESALNIPLGSHRPFLEGFLQLVLPCGVVTSWVLVLVTLVA